MVATYRRNPRVIALFLAPSLVIYGLFLVIPIIASLVLAFYDWPGISGAPFDFTAFKNFRIVLSYPQFWESVRHILWWIILTLLTQIPIGFLLANLFCSRFRGYSIYQIHCVPSTSHLRDRHRDAVVLHPPAAGGTQHGPLRSSGSRGYHEDGFPTREPP